MAAPLTASIPPGLDLGAAYVIQFTALNPTSGAVVANVTVSGASLLVVNIVGSLPGDVLEPVSYEWLNLPVEVGA